MGLALILFFNRKAIASRSHICTSTCRKRIDRHTSRDKYLIVLRLHANKRPTRRDDEIGLVYFQFQIAELNLYERNGVHCVCVCVYAFFTLHSFCCATKHLNIFVKYFYCWCWNFFTFKHDFACDKKQCIKKKKNCKGLAFLMLLFAIAFILFCTILLMCTNNDDVNIFGEGDIHILHHCTYCVPTNTLPTFIV